MFDNSHRLVQSRYGVIVSVVLFIAYCQIYYWFSSPDLLWFTVQWVPDNVLIVDSILDNTTEQDLLKIGDQILSIDGRVMEQGKPIFVPPIQPSYDVQLLRGGQQHHVELIPKTTTPIIFSITSVIAFVGWLTGSVIVLFRRQTDVQAIFIGYFFLFSCAALIGIEAFTSGVPGAWLIGHVGVFFLFPLFLFMGFLPRQEPITGASKKALLASIVIAIGLAMLAMYEKLILFPSGSSWELTIGVSTNSVGYMLIGIGMLLWLSILLVRMLRAPRSGYRREGRTLLFFVASGVLPIAVGVALPYVLIGRPWLPIVFALSTLLFIPVGYFFLVYRRGHLAIDIWMGRLLMLFLLCILLFALYMGVLFTIGVENDLTYLLDYRYQAILAVITIITLFYARKPIEQFVDYVINGDVFLTEQRIQTYAARLVTSLDFHTLQSVVTEVADGMNLEQVLVCGLTEYDDGINLALNVKHDELPKHIIQEPIAHAVLKTSQHPVFRGCEWAELAVPIPVAAEQNGGYMLLSAPNHNGFFNAREVEALTHLMDVVALSIQAVLYSDSIERRSAEMLAIQQQERGKIGSAIHHGPEFTIKMLVAELENLPDGGLSAEKLPTIIDKLTKVRQELTTAYRQLDNPLLNQGVVLAVRKIVETFRARNELPLVVIDIEEAAEDCELSDTGMNALWWLVAESLNNAARHGNAAHVCITIHCQQANLMVKVADDGCGIKNPQQKLRTLRMQNEHYGVMSMLSWVKAANGHFWLDTNDNGGTTVSCSLPVTKLVA